MSVYIDQLNEAVTTVRNSFIQLTEEQLNWKPLPEKWSIAQCLDHLVNSDEAYYPVFEKIISGTHTPSLWTRISPFSTFFGNWLTKNSGAVVNKKIKNPKIFSPAYSRIDTGIVKRYIDHVETMKSYVGKLTKMDTDKIKIASPASAIVTYSLADAITLLTGHEIRHVTQAINIFNHPQFPK
jgi:uncharacterized damage-inducible protein DinB